MSNIQANRPTVRSLTLTAMPIAAFCLTGILLGLTDLAVVGVLGTDALAAVGLGKTIMFSLMVIGFAVLSIGTVLMAERTEARHRGAVFVAVLIVTFPFIILGLVLPTAARAVLVASAYEPQIVRLFGDYTGVVSMAIGPALVFASLKNVLVAVGRTWPIVALSVLILVGNATASILLVHGFGQWDGMGVAGAAWATVGVETAAALVLAGFVARRGYLRFAGIRAIEVIARLRDVIALGWAAGAQQVLESFLFVAVLYLLGLQSAAWLAAGTVAFAVMELNYAIGGAIGEVAAARMAALRTAGDGAGKRHLVRLTIALCGVAAGLFALFVLVFPSQTVSLFSGEATAPEARALMEIVLMASAPFFLCDAWQVAFIHLLRGLRRTVLPMALSTSCYWGLGIGGGLILGELIGLGGAGVWVGFCVGLASAAALLGLMTFKTAGRDSSA